MFVHYVRQLLNAEEGLNETEKTRLAEQIEAWAKRHGVSNLVRMHEILDDWIDKRLQCMRVISLNQDVGEDTEISCLVQDPKASDPAEIVIADEEFRHAGIKEARSYVNDNLDGDSKELLLDVIKPCRSGGYNVDEDSPIIRQNAAIINPRIKKGKLLVPKKVISFKVSNNNLKIKYRLGFSDEKVNQALCLYSKSFNPSQIAKKMGMKEATIYDWLYDRMDLPRIGNPQMERQRNTRINKILSLYDSGMRPLEIKERLDCSDYTVYEALRRFKGLNFGWGGPDPWVYKLTGSVSAVSGLRNLDLPRKLQRNGGQRQYDCKARYEQVFRYVKEFYGQHNRGPTGDEIKDALGFKVWYYLDDMMKFDVISKKKLVKEKIYTPNFF